MTTKPVPQRANTPSAAPEHMRLACRVTRLLSHLLQGTDWKGVRFADKRRLGRELLRLEGDLLRVRAVTGSTTAPNDEQQNP